MRVSLDSDMKGVAGRSRHACVAQGIHVGHKGNTKRQTEESSKEAAREAGNTPCKHAPQAKYQGPAMQPVRIADYALYSYL